MTLTRFALRNPLVVAALSLAVLVVGLAGYPSMGTGITPNISLPTVVITTTDAGADPTTIETHVTTPIENAVAALANVDTVTSTSDKGQSVVTVAFTAAGNSTLAPLDVERAVNAVRNRLPAEPDPPTITTHTRCW